MPYEKELIYNLFDLKNHQYTNVINITNLDNTILNKNCNHYQNELDDLNNNIKTNNINNTPTNFKK